MVDAIASDSRGSRSQRMPSRNRGVVQEEPRLEIVGSIEDRAETR